MNNVYQYMWSLVCDSAWRAHVTKFFFLLGSFLGYIILGTLSDRFGRLPVLILSILLMLIFGIMVAMSSSIKTFITLFFFEGFCLAGITLSIYVLRIELCLPTWRFAVTMMANFVTMCGELLLPAAAFLSYFWQVFQMLIIFTQVPMLYYLWEFPESLRWLMATQQYYRSKIVMELIARENEVNTDQSPHNIMLELHKALPREPKRTCILKMLQARNLWKHMCVLCFNSLTANGIHECFVRRMMDPEAKGVVMLQNFFADYYTVGGISMLSCLALCPVMGELGRRGGLLMFMVVTALAALLQMGLLSLLGKYSDNLDIDKSDVLMKNISIVFSIIGMFAAQAVSNLTILLSAELTPTVMRGGGVGLVLASGGFGKLTAPIMELHKGYFLNTIVFACCTIICFICIPLLPETCYQFLPETLDDDKTVTRKPVLSPRKPVEQHPVLVQGDTNSDYGKVYETLLQDASTAAAAIISSTTTSVVDLITPSVSNYPNTTTVVNHNNKPGLKSPGVLRVSSSPMKVLGENGVIHVSDDDLPSSSSLCKRYLEKDPLYADETSAAVAVASVEPLTEAFISNCSDHMKFDSPLLKVAHVPIEDYSTLSLDDSLLSSPESTPLPFREHKCFHDTPPTLRRSCSIPNNFFETTYTSLSLYDSHPESNLPSPASFTHDVFDIPPPITRSSSVPAHLEIRGEFIPFTTDSQSQPLESTSLSAGNPLLPASFSASPVTVDPRCTPLPSDSGQASPTDSSTPPIPVTDCNISPDPSPPQHS